MSTLEAIFLGIIQGFTEFLPVSSSGHLALFQHFLGLQNLKDYVLFDVVCHMGTLCSIFCVFHRQIREIDRKMLTLIVLATLPLFPFVLILKEIKHMFDQLQFLGYFFLLTALLLWLGSRFGRNDKEVDWKDAVGVGFFQVLALLPGVSRSGSTVSGARMLGWNIDKAITFSFLLAIPAILGATTLEVLHVATHHSPLPNIAVATYVAGFSTAFCTGIIALFLLFRLANKGKFHYFMWYCMALGMLTLYTFNK